MGKPMFSTPPLFQSKLFCFSFIYLFSAVFLAGYSAFSATKCIFRSSPFDPIQAPLFSYPSSYGEHKYAISTTRSSCDFPVYFSDYWVALKEIQELCANSSGLLGRHGLKYTQGNAETFGGNLSIDKRLSYFDNNPDDRFVIPCGFFTPFPITSSDRISMEKCDGVVVVSAIFNDHDKIRQPKGLGSKTLNDVCFFMFVDDTTHRRLDFHNLISRKSKEHKIGAWRIVKVSNEDLYQNAAMNGMIPKYLIHRLFPNSKYSVWVDAKLQLVVDPLLLIHSLVVKEKVDMAISKHPYFLHTMEEAMATARWSKWWDVNGLKIQMETYCENGLQPWSSKKPYPTDVPDSALILRKHSSATNLFSCLLFNELEAFNPRDQLPFAYVRDRMKPKLKLNMFEVEVFEQITMEYRHNLKQGGAIAGGPKVKWASSDLSLSVNGSCSKCEGYLLKMWVETHD
ncbi:alkaline ceramidase TOD1-like [Primulina eburnea]|uniref:alkaline ceramidase TOD1-like n=1 Tax=Primulina eburnea TaxID=1245227 RepID=UPI003C6CB9F7